MSYLDQYRKTEEPVTVTLRNRCGHQSEREYPVGTSEMEIAIAIDANRESFCDACIKEYRENPRCCQCGRGGVTLAEFDYFENWCRECFADDALFDSITREGED